MNNALILIDIQNDYFPNGSMELQGMEAAAENAGILLRRFRQEQRMVLHVQHLSVRPGSTFFLPGSQGARIHDLVAPENRETVIQKNYPNGFRQTELHDCLRKDNIDELVICGAMSHMCIDATTRAAYDLGFQCTVVHDACATRDLSFNGEAVKAADVHAAFMAALAAPYAKVVGSRDVAVS